jgi:hypothetical protein
MIGLLVRYLLSVRKFNRDPEQHELAQLFIDYADGHKPWQAVFEFLEQRQWAQSRDSRELRITHALSLVKVQRLDVYRQASELGRLIMFCARHCVDEDAFRTVARLAEADETAKFAPAIIISEPSTSSPPSSAERLEGVENSPSPTCPVAAPGRIEIVLTHGRRVIVDTGVDAAALARVLAVLERS